MICPLCDHDNLPGSDQCSNCQQDLTQLDRPFPHDRVEHSLMHDPVSILQPRSPLTLTSEATVAEAINKLLEHNIGAILITDESSALVGIFSERDLLMKVAGLSADYPTRPVREFMTPRPETVRESDTLAFAMLKMNSGGYRHLPVMQDGQLIGVISVRDMLEHITRICNKTPTSS